MRELRGNGATKARIIALHHDDSKNGSFFSLDCSNDAAICIYKLDGGGSGVRDA